MALALGLGVLGSLAFFVSENVYAYAAMPVVALLAAWLVPDWRRGLGGLVVGLGLIGLVLAVGGYVVGRAVLLVVAGRSVRPTA